MRERCGCRVARFVVAVAVPIGALAFAAPLRGQAFGTFFRGDEVGPSTLRFDEETFMNILSYEQPLESVQPFLAADGGWQLALGSLRSKVLWYEQDLKYRAEITDQLAARALIHNGIDLDNDYTQIQAMPELKLSDHWYVALPVVLASNKGEIDGGLAATYRAPTDHVDFVQLEWVRSDRLYNEKNDVNKQSQVDKPADNFELQTQADLFGFGKTTVILADEAPNKIDYVEEEHIDAFSRFTAKVLQCYDWDAKRRAFLDARYEIANERSTQTGPLGAGNAFDGSRDLFSTRGEVQFDQDDEKTTRWRGGAVYLYFRENSVQPNDPMQDNTELRREAMVYAGYRSPLNDSKEVDLETVVYLDHLNNVRRYPNDPTQDDRDPQFQGKISFYFRWHAAERAEFVLSPSFELDSIGWGGGCVMLRYRL